MTTGAPIYLVSACTSGDEFISAFRRYADRNGVMFIPIAEPLPAGRKGRFALALSNGGVMIEGQAEVVSSAKTPSVLYGRVGMTVKFLAPDEPSQTMLAELEKARTSLKPPAPSVAPRPAEVPAEPRPKPPATGGRIDAVNALAECVVIGDVSTLSRDSDLGTIPPPMGKVPSGPVPVPVSRAPSGAIPTPIAKSPSGSTMPPPFKPPAKAAAPGLPGMPATDRTKSPSVPPIPSPISSGSSGPIGKSTTLGMPSIDRKPSGTLPAPNAPPPAAKPLSIAPPPPITQPAPSREEAVAAALRFAQAVEARTSGVDHTIRGTTPAAMMTIASPPPAGVIVEPEVDPEATDLTTVPPAPIQTSSRRTEIGVAVTASGAHVLPAAPARKVTDDETRDTSQMAALSDMAADEPTNPLDEDGLVHVEQVDPLGSTQAALRLSKLQPTIEEPSGDWLMSTSDGALTITPRVKEPEPGDTKTPPKGPPTGDWLIALDPSRPDGWSEPSKVEKRPAGELPPGPPVSAVASDKLLDSEARAQPAMTTDEPKIQIDPTLIQPVAAMPVEPLAASSPVIPFAAAQPFVQPGAVPILPVRPPSAPPVAFVTPPVGTPQLASASGSAPAIEYPRVATEAGIARSEAARKRRLVIILASAFAAVVIGVIVVLFLLGGEDKTSEPTPPPAPAVKSSIVVPPPTPDAAIVEPAVTEPAKEVVAAVEPTPEPEAKKPEPVVETATTCTLTVTTVPSAAEVSVGGESFGPSPTTLTLPCGTRSTITAKKARYQTATREVTPKPTSKAVKLALARTTFTVKVTSVPTGATVTLGGKALGVTPAMVKLPSFEASTIKIAKDGYTAEMQKVTPKNNSAAVSVSLKKSAKSPKRK